MNLFYLVMGTMFGFGLHSVLRVVFPFYSVWREESQCFYCKGTGLEANELKELKP